MFKNFGYPFFLLLLPVFFVFHGYLENFGFISAGPALGLAAIYLMAVICLWGLFWFFTRNRIKAALMAFACMCFFFFFGAILDFFKEHIVLLSHYSILLPVIFVLLVIFFIYLRKTSQSFFRLTIFLNLLFAVYIVIDAAELIKKLLHPEKQALSVYGLTEQQESRRCDTCARPNIYFLLMDEYASSFSLKQQYNFDNDIDSFLQQRKFRVLPYSRSNYNFTPFSVASVLNMQYISNIKDPRAVGFKDYQNCRLIIWNNRVIKLLDAYGYEIYNYSIFDLPGRPALILQPLLPIQTRLITQRTMFTRIDIDIGWQIWEWYPLKLFARNTDIAYRENNFRIAALVKQMAAGKKAKPGFVYAHFNMPHYPFYFDKSGRARDLHEVHSELGNPPVRSYLDHVQFTNTRLKDLVTFIQQHDPTAAIMIYGDHGFRKRTDADFPVQHFQNMNAVYVPNQDYSLFYDSITGVNQFRVFFNTVFHQQLPLLKDSSIYLRDK